MGTRRCCAVALSISLLAPVARAIDDRADTEPNDVVPEGRRVAWKLTLGDYRSTAGGVGHDVNLRGNTEVQSFWAGLYDQGDGVRQARAGLEHQQAVPVGRLILSAQVASKGFVGGSITWEAAESPDAPVFGLLGFGRTNGAPYVNLNFDPNDSVLFGGGWRIDDARQLTVFQIRDDRFDTGQRVSHLVYRAAFAERSRLTLDVFRRRGGAFAGAPLERGNGFSLGWDRAGWFVRLARDPKADFTPATMTRVSVGVRF